MTSKSRQPIKITKPTNLSHAFQTAFNDLGLKPYDLYSNLIFLADLAVNSYKGGDEEDIKAYHNLRRNLGKGKVNRHLKKEKAQMYWVLVSQKAANVFRGKAKLQATRGKPPSLESEKNFPSLTSKGSLKVSNPANDPIDEFKQAMLAQLDDVGKFPRPMGKDRLVTVVNLLSMQKPKEKSSWVLTSAFVDMG